MNSAPHRTMVPFLLGATLVFWGWQSQLFPPGLLMAVLLEGALWIHTRWDLSDRDFNRIWTFCTVLLLAVIVYAFSSNEGPSHFGGFLQHPDLKTERGVGTSTAKTMAQVLRWLPMIFFFFIAAQQYSTSGSIPLQTISLILRWQWRKAKKSGQPLPERRSIDVSYVYFALCLLAASVHAADDTSYFWGLCVLVAWALWPRRARNAYIWAGAVGLAVGLGYFGQGGLGRMRIYLEGFNPQWLSNLPRSGADPNRSKTALGQVGRLKGSSKIVIRLEPNDGSHPPSLLREASYREYYVAREFNRTEWKAGNSKDDLETIYADKKQGENTYVLVPGKSNLLSKVTIASYVDRPKGILPLPEGVAKVENLYINQMQKNQVGAVLVDAPGLVIFDAYYGPGETLDSPPDPAQDLSGVRRNTREAEALEQIIEEFHLEGVTREKTLQNIMAFFETHFSYSTWQDQPLTADKHETALSRFLLRTRKGHCEYFATATVLLLREMGIPARYAVGYAVHEAAGKKYIVRQRDAHAWCLVWNEAKQVWENFDTTPASWMAAEAKQASVFEFLSDLWSGLIFQISKLRWGQTHVREYIFWGITPVLGILLFQIISRVRRSRKGRGKGNESVTWPGLDSEFYELEQRLSRRGFARENSEPLGRWLSRAALAPGLSDVAPPLQKVFSLHYRYRFDPRGLTPAERDALRREARECLDRIE
jgi:hypothetical protein